MPTWSDKLLQEVMRMILEAYYEPQFSDKSCGFRPERGCHTALREIYYNWHGTVWFIEGDIAQCFDALDHTILLETLSRNIHDGRFIHLISELLKAGYLEEWKFNQTLSGTPQGGIVSPLLSNVYLDQLDTYVEETLVPAYNTGVRRKANYAYSSKITQAYRLRRQGKQEEARALVKQAQTMPAIDPTDPDFRRLKYVRYADDFLLGFIGTRAEAEEIKRRLGTFMREELKLELSQTKTLITNAKTELARFLGYQVHTMHEDRARHGRTHARTINGTIGLRIPRDVIFERCQYYLENGRAIHRAEMINDSDFSIVETFQSRYRGLVEYYRLAYNLISLSKLRWRMQQSLVKTLAAKFKTTMNHISDTYRAEVLVKGRRYSCLQVIRPREGKKPLVAQWGGISLEWNIRATIHDHPQKAWNSRTELEKRLLAQECELCGNTNENMQIQVHHIRALKDLNRYTGREKPQWVQVMAARRRKTLVVCRTCHEDITHGHPMRRHMSSSRKLSKL